MKKILSLLIGFGLSGFSGASQAENLLQIYQQARTTNPDLRSSIADRDAAFERIHQSRSSLLPQLGLSASYNYSQSYHDPNGINLNTTNGSLTLTQKLFDMAAWRALTLQEKQAGIQEISLQTQQQALMLNTANAYFDVLRAIDELAYTNAQKQALYRQLDQTTQRFNVGLVAITDVQNARASYDNILAEEVSVRNTLDNAAEALRLFTGNDYPLLASLNIDRFSTEKMPPINNLLEQAENHNLSLISARLTQDLAREQVRSAEAGHMPTLSLQASTGLNHNDKDGRLANQGITTTNGTKGNHQIGLNVSLPLYSGGAVISQVKQAEYAFVSASEKLESVHRNMVKTLRSSYNNLNASISSIKANEQTVVSAQSSLDATKVGYQVGTRTIVDILDATTTLFNAKKKLSSARYDYLINNLKIQSALGSLNEQNLATLNNYLGKEISTTQDNQKHRAPKNSTANITQTTLASPIKSTTVSRSSNSAVSSRKPFH